MALTGSSRGWLPEKTVFSRRKPFAKTILSRRESFYATALGNIEKSSFPEKTVLSRRQPFDQFLGCACFLVKPFNVRQNFSPSFLRVQALPQTVWRLSPAHTEKLNEVCFGSWPGIPGQRFFAGDSRPGIPGQGLLAKDS